VKHYKFVDWATQVYVALTGLLILCFHGDRVPGWSVLVAAHLVCLLSIHLLLVANSTGRWRIAGLARHFYPLLLYGALYHESGLLNQMLVTGYLDPYFFRLEGRVFGGQPGLMFMERFPYLAVSEVLYAAYFSYYVMIGGVGVALFLKDREKFFHYVSIISFVFYVCSLLYIFLPVVGPRIVFEPSPVYRLPDNLGLPAGLSEYPGAVGRGPFCRIMAFIFRHFEAPGAAFPSSHVAVALCTLYFSNRYLTRIRGAHAVVVLLLCLATVYGRYHYVVDVLAGVLVAVVLVPLGNRLYRRLK
jgi:membrane-associated phospholipid phosphatase